jgi:hypothetical protein
VAQSPYNFGKFRKISGLESVGLVLDTSQDLTDKLQKLIVLKQSRITEEDAENFRDLKKFKILTPASLYDKWVENKSTIVKI